MLLLQRYSLRKLEYLIEIKISEKEGMKHFEKIQAY